MDTSIYERSTQLSQQQQAVLAAIAELGGVGGLAEKVFMEHIALPELHPMQEQEQLARDSASYLAERILAICKLLRAG